MSEHEPWCRKPEKPHTDGAKRLSDTYNLHRTASGLLNFEVVGKWFAAALNDGSSDGVLYDSKLECVLHQHHNEQYYTFVKICPGGMNVCEAEVVLRTARTLYNNGFRVADPDHRHGGVDVIKRLTIEDQRMAARGIVTGLLMPMPYGRNSS